MELYIKESPFALDSKETGKKVKVDGQTILPELSKAKIGIIGLGYVGLPLAVEFARKFSVIGYDIADKRINELVDGKDVTLEVDNNSLKDVMSDNIVEVLNNGKGFYPTSSITPLSSCNIYIITVPTPTDKYNRPVLTPMLLASEMIGKVLKKGDVVIYEPTVFPGATEEECVPVLEKYSGLKFNQDFYVGYSPERINPGDQNHKVSKIIKITSGSTSEVADFVDLLYKEIVKAGTFKASSIKVAEAAKVIENSQRDINIAFVNELSKIFNLLGIDTQEVLEAAGTKWNFMSFKPGLVGGHCIGVDPYYLAQKAQEVGYHPEIILAGRRVNDSMGKYVATEVIKLMMRKDLKVIDSKVLILGFTFKENCPDIRNTRVIDIFRELHCFDIDVDIYDPLASYDEVLKEYGIKITTGDNIPEFDSYSAIILAVSHNQFLNLPIKKSNNRVVYDVKGFLPKEVVDGRL